MQLVQPDMIVHPDYLIAEHGIVAEEDGVTVGYAIVRVDGEQAFLRDLFVEPEWMRCGIGMALFCEAVAYAVELGAVELSLGGDPNAIGFYERMGMRQIGEEPSIVGGGRMLPIMTLDLRGIKLGRETASGLYSGLRLKVPGMMRRPNEYIG